MCRIDLNPEYKRVAENWNTKSKELTNESSNHQNNVINFDKSCSFSHCVNAFVNSLVSKTCMKEKIYI